MADAGSNESEGNSEDKPESSEHHKQFEQQLLSMLMNMGGTVINTKYLV